MDGREYNWDDTIEKDSDFILLPEGEYVFSIVNFERARHNGSDKLPPCNKAVVYIKITDGMHETVIKHNLFLHSITEGMLSAFFIGIGQKEHGKPLKMDWNNVVGSTGKCKIKIDKWTNNKGEILESNKIKKFLEPKQKTFTTNNF